ncbi:MAG: hypothetical protein HYZ23_10880 [Chloroflexi bacterium]|nr:hypothetical protein [Chloroflexota bacterium]
MNATSDKNKPRRVGRGKRKHIRRMKQEARKASIPGNEPKKKVRPV